MSQPLNYQHGARAHANYGKGHHVIHGAVELEYDEQRLEQELLAKFKRPDYRPPQLPAVALELMRVSRQPNVSLEDVVRLLGTDPMLAAEVLKVARSPMYAGRGASESLHRAVVRLGLGTLRNVVMEAAMSMRIFRSETYTEPLERLRKHCVVTAVAARTIAKHTPFDTEEAYLCGLLHDVGTAGILLALGDVPRGGTPPDLDALWPAIDRSHAEASQILVELWGLGSGVALAVGAHHFVKIDGFAHPMASVVCLAEQFASQRGMGLLPHGRQHFVIDRTAEPTLEVAVQAVGLNPTVAKLVLAEVDEAIAEG